MEKINELQKEWDLTNKKELTTAERYLFYANPLLFVGKKIIDSIFNSDTSERQAKAAEELIKQGKENGVDNMEITIDNTKGFKLNIPIEDVKIDTMIGGDEKMIIKVKYK